VVFLNIVWVHMNQDTQERNNFAGLSQTNLHKFFQFSDYRGIISMVTGINLPAGISQLLNEQEDVEWAKEIHGVPKSAKSVAIGGNEDSPSFVYWSRAKEPTIHTQFYEVKNV